MNRKKLAAIICGGVCVLMVVVYVVVVYFGKAVNAEVRIDESKLYPVTYVVDGDTFKARIDGKEITVRVLGINTPETVDPRKPVECYGPEASEEAKSLLVGRSVRLELNLNREHRDKYGRYLLYVHRNDGLFYNEFMIKEGYAREYTFGSAYSLQVNFRKAEGEAKDAKKGLWGVCVDSQFKKIKSS